MAEMSFITNDKRMGALQNAVRKLERSASEGDIFFQDISKMDHNLSVLSNGSEGFR